MTIEIYDATVDDIATIQELAQTVLLAEHSADKTAVLLKRLYSDTALQQAINNENTTILLAYEGDTLAGYCRYGAPLLDDCEDARSIHQWLIHPAHDMAAIGDDFIAIMEDELDEEACTQRIIVYVPATDRPRLRFFLGNGFMHILVEDTEHEWYLEKEL